MNDTERTWKQNSAVFARQSWPETAVELERALAWLRHLGVRYEQGRFANYEKHINELATTAERGIAPRDMSVVLTAAYESHDLIEIHKQLANEHHAKLVDRLNEFVSGPDSYANEGVSSNAPRNFGFELIVLATLSMAGLRLNFDIDADAAASFEDYVLVFECKRPQARKSIRRRYNKACSQLRKKYDSPEGAGYRGIVALDVTKVLNEDCKFRVFPDDAALHSALDDVGRRYVLAPPQLHMWNVIPDPSTMGVWVRFAAISMVSGGDPPIMWGETFPFFQRKPETIGDKNVALCRAFYAEVQRSREALGARLGQQVLGSPP